MEINSMTGNTISLQEYARQTPQNSEFAGNLKKRGKEVLEQAVDVFFKQDRTLQEAKSSVNFLKDLEQAISVCLEKTKEQTKANEKAAMAKASHITETHEGLNQETVNRGSSKIVYEDKSAYCDNPKIPALTGVESFFGELHKVIPLFACACMTPGPMAESVKTFAREAMHGSLDASSHSRFNAALGGGQISLLKAGAFSGEASGKSDSKTTAEISSDKTTTDERIISTLMDLESKLERIKIEEGTVGEIKAKRTYSIFENTGFLTEKYTTTWADSDLPAKPKTLEKFEHMPAHIWFPEN